MKTGRRISRKTILFVTLAVCLVLLLVEAILQVAAMVLIPPWSGLPGSIVERDEELGWVFKGSRVQEEYGGFELRFNSLGLRGGEIESTPVDRMILGDSVVMASEIPEDKTIASLLGAINAGFAGYSTMQERDRYKRDLFQLKPQTLVLVITCNDIFSEEQNRNHIDRQVLINPHLRNRTWLEYEGLYRLYLWRKGLLGRNPTIDETMLDQAHLEQASKACPDYVWHEWTAAVLDIRDSAADSEFYVVLSPPRSQVRARQDGVQAFWLNDNLEALCRSQDMVFLDLLPVLAEHDVAETFLGTIHLSEEGNRIAAEAIAKLLGD